MATDDGEAQQLYVSSTSADIAEALEARVKDPLWFLARQWQSGEFEAENGGRLGAVSIEWSEFPIQSIRLGDEESNVSLDAPLEWAVEAEDATGESPAWHSEALEYRFTAKTAAHDLTAEEYDGRWLDWFHFDVDQVDTKALPASRGGRRVVPTNLAVSGAPHPRWWRFEDGDAPFDVVPDPEPNVLSTLLPEFFYVDVNNWYVVPIAQTAGSVREITKLEVIDSFGFVTELGPAEGNDWALFALSPTDATGGEHLGGRLNFVPNVAIHVLHNDDVEDVRFLRDEEANLVWAWERLYRDSEGRPVFSGDRPEEGQEEGAPAVDSEGLPRYVFRSETPPYWIPYVPRFARRADAMSGEIYLRRARSVESTTRAAPQYRTRIVSESWRLEEHEVPRSGVRVRRIARFARSSDGTGFFWTGRQAEVSPVAPHPSLRFDYLEGE